MEHVILWEAPAIIKPEFRLYYDDKGNVLFYTCEKPEGNYIVIDATTYAIGRPDIRVIDGKISTVVASAVVSKLMPNKEDGITCAEEDISIIVDKTYKGKTINWKLTTYELE
jgi:hypothetical protein